MSSNYKRTLTLTVPIKCLVIDAVERTVSEPIYGDAVLYQVVCDLEPQTRLKIAYADRIVNRDFISARAIERVNFHVPVHDGQRVIVDVFSEKKLEGAVYLCFMVDR